MLVALISLFAAELDEPVALSPPPVIAPISAAPPAPPVPPGQAAKPGDGTNLVSLFSTDDYPQAALRAGEQGTVGVRLTVTTEGRVGNCEILTSSGSQTLDRATCDILQRRARFTPARDQNGRPVVDYYTQRIRWEIPEQIHPFSDMVERMILRLNDETRVVSCRFERDGQSVELPDCAQMQRPAETTLAGWKKAARGMTLVIERRFETNPSGSVPAKHLTNRQALVARGVIEFDIDPAGQAHNCKQLVREGDAAKADLCVVEGSLEFEPAAGIRRARLSVTTHLEPQRTGRRPQR